MQSGLTALFDYSLQTSSVFPQLHNRSSVAALILYCINSDVSWGTKGDNKISTDLGTVKAGKDTNQVEVAVPTAEKDINAAYEDAMHVLSTKPPPVSTKPDVQTQQEDYYRSFRTKCVSHCALVYCSY